MATGKKCRCRVTGEIGTTDTFIKVGRFYYKSQEIYEEDKQQKELRKRLISYICDHFLGYQEGEPFSPVLPRKLKELSFYNDAVILETFQIYEKEILYWLKQKEFHDDYNKIAYMFAIVRSKIADVNREHLRKKRIAEKEKQEVFSFTDPTLSTGTNKEGKDLSVFLEGDDL